MKLSRHFCATTRNVVAKGLITPMRSVPQDIKKTDYYLSGRPSKSPEQVYFFEKSEISKMRKSALLARKVLDYACSIAQAGMSTEDLDILCHEKIVKYGAYPSPINYCGFPKAICTSVNEVVCHGIPDSRLLNDGDILSIDVSVYLDGYHGDNCGTIIVGGPRKSDPSAERLVKCAQEALEAGIAVCRPGNCLSSIGAAIEDHATKNRFRVISEFMGHGVGRNMHMQPFVSHVKNTEKFTLKPGMVITIEPILVEGSPRIGVWDDGWTAYTIDSGRGAQFEHEVLITENGAEILTVPS